MSLKKIILYILLFGAFGIFLLNIQSCFANTRVKKDRYEEAEKILNNYFKARSSGLYEECKKFFSDEYLNKFIKEYGTNFTDYFKNQNEDYYKDSKVIKKLIRKDGVIVINVSTIVEGPGYSTRAVESYFLDKEKGYLLIVDWKIKYQD